MKSIFTPSAGKAFGVMLLAIAGVGFARKLFAPGTFVGDFVDGNF